MEINVLKSKVPLKLPLSVTNIMLIDHLVDYAMVHITTQFYTERQKKRSTIFFFNLPKLSCGFNIQKSLPVPHYPWQNKCKKDDESTTQCELL